MVTEAAGELALETIRAVSFDCYGTLIDWERGIAAYVRPHLERAGRGGNVVGPAEWLAAWEPIQFAMLTPWRPYREVLAESFEATMRRLELECFADGGPGLAHSLAEWPPFADTAAAMRRMARRRRLAIISNTDDALLAETIGRLLVPLSAIVSAEEVQAYKPDPAPFREALARLGLAPGEVLHAAFGWKYDLGTARALGMRTCFVNRGAIARPEGLAADLEVPSLEALAERLDAAPPR
jgi:2-haloalkanoic acid dehalogenase type II